MDPQELNNLTTKAIKMAISQKWQEAEEINKKILQHNPHDIDTLNRQGTVFINLAEYKKAKAVFEKALALDSLNSIALKNLKLLKAKRAVHQVVVPGKYNLKGALKAPDKHTRQKTKPYIKHAGLEEEDSENPPFDEDPSLQDLETNNYFC